MNKFKIGDKVECITSGWNTSPEEIGKIFTVRSINQGDNEDEITLEEERPHISESDFEGDDDNRYPESNERGFKLVPKVINWEEELK